MLPCRRIGGDCRCGISAALSFQGSELPSSVGLQPEWDHFWTKAGQFLGSLVSIISIGLAQKALSGCFLEQFNEYNVMYYSKPLEIFSQQT